MREPIPHPTMPDAAPNAAAPASAPAEQAQLGQAPECYGDVCVTCSDQAVPVQVVRLLDDDLALVDTGVSREEVSVAFVDAAVGDTVLVHAKEAIQQLTTS